MALFDIGADINTVASGSQTLGSVGGNLGSFLGTAGKLAGALNNLSDPSQLISKLRSINLPAGGTASGQCQKEVDWLSRGGPCPTHHLGAKGRSP